MHLNRCYSGIENTSDAADAPEHGAFNLLYTVYSFPLVSRTSARIRCRVEWSGVEFDGAAASVRACLIRSTRALARVCACVRVRLRSRCVACEPNARTISFCRVRI